MQEAPVVFIAFLEQDNLGIGYLASVLLREEILVRIIDYSLGKEEIKNQILGIDPVLIGFSIIFQYHIHDFKELIDYLRLQGVDCHFCAGGHYPSLRYAELFQLIPALDSIALYEGEHTLFDLVSSIRSGEDWKGIPGIAYPDHSSIITNPLRPLESDLDNFPPPVRQPLPDYALGKKYATLLAGRGCYYDCAFCSIREFYSRPPGPVKRIRRPEMVVKEMELLQQERDCSVFMFQDDDFPVSGKKGREWTTIFCDLLMEIGLSEKIIWKINCRPDEIDRDLFGLMKSCGLFLVYLGIEDGTEAGLKLMNKKLRPETNLQSVRSLNELGIMYDYGFMLFNPESTFQSVAENLNFLERICGDGSSPITFCKMLPYAETQVESRLINEGRLIGELGFEDYSFRDPYLDHYFSFLTACFEEWIGKRDGVLNLARWARYTAAVYQAFWPVSAEFSSLQEELIDEIRHSNLVVIDQARELLRIYQQGDRTAISTHRLLPVKEQVSEAHQAFRVSLMDKIEKIEALASTDPG